jgi:peptidoglycan/LPS O-acetylase OafA/YrhL
VTTNRLPALDGLRGLAIASVVAYHCFGWPAGGHLGVDLFFVLSGFLITTLLLRERLETGRISLRAFYARRAARLLPALALMLAAYLAIAAVKGEDGVKAVLLGGLYFGNVMIAFTGESKFVVLSGIGHLWSLAEEEQFYLVWPILLPIVARSRRPARLVLALGLALVTYKFVLMLLGATHHRLYNGPDTHAEGLVAGASVAFLIARRPDFTLPRSTLAVTVPFVVLFLFGRTQSTGWDAVGLPLAETGCVALVVAALTLSEWQRFLSLAPLRFLGRISYSLYLWHAMLMWATDQHLGWLVVPASIAIAYLSTTWLEEPVRARVRRVRPVTAPAPAPAPI